MYFDIFSSENQYDYTPKYVLTNFNMFIHIMEYNYIDFH